MIRGRKFVLAAVLLGMIFAQAAMADVLFKYPVEADAAHAIGTVVKMDGDQIVAAAAGDRDILGVVVAYEADGAEHFVLVANAGQLAIRVASAVNAGDRLTISATAGAAQTAANDEDILVAVALEDAAAAGTIIAQIMVIDNQAKYSAYDNTGDLYITSDNVQGALGDLDTKIGDILGGTGTVNSLDNGDITTVTNLGGGVWETNVTTDAADFSEAGGALSIADNAIQSAEIENGTIVNEDISATADIAVSKLDGGTDGQILSTVAGAPTWSDVSAVNQDLTEGAGIADFTYDGSATATVAINNAWFNGDALVGATGTVTIQDNAVDDNDIDWGTGAGEISATDMPIADAGGYYATDDVEAALQALGSLTGGSVVNQITGGNGIVPNGPSTGNVTLNVDLTELNYTGLTAASATQLNVVYGTGANTAVEGNETATITAGSGLTGGIAADALGDGFTSTLTVGDGNGLTVNDDDIDVNVDDATIEIATDALRVKADGINDSHIDWGTGANEVAAGDVPLVDTDDHFTTNDVEFAIDALADRIDEVESGGGQQVLSDDVTAANLNDDAVWSTLAQVTYTSTYLNPIVLNFTGTFDDRGGNNGAYFEVQVYNGSAVLETRTIIINDRNYHQSQEVSINAYIASPATGVTYSVRAKQVKDPYDSGRAVNGRLILMEVNG